MNADLNKHIDPNNDDQTGIVKELSKIGLTETVRLDLQKETKNVNGSKLSLILTGMTTFSYEFTTAVDNQITKVGDNMYKIGEEITVFKIENKTDENQWSKFGAIMELVLDYQKTGEFRFAERLKHLIIDNISLEVSVLMEGTLILTEMNDQIQFKLKKFDKIWKIDPLLWKYAKNLNTDHQLLIYNADYDFYFQFFNGNDRNILVDLFEKFKARLSNQVIDDDKEELRKLETGVSYERQDDSAVRVENDDKRVLHTGKIVFPKSTTKDYYHFHSHCGITNSKLRAWITLHINENPPPHWRNCPDVKQVSRKFIQGDPIEGQANDQLYFHKNVARPNISRPFDYRKRDYPDYI